MTAFDEERIARLLGALPPAPLAWIRAAQELPLAQTEFDQIVARAEADIEFRERLLEDLETALELEGYERDESVVAALKRRYLSR